tara:strand:+ start:44281 stop:44895 length:615 start_codon:yes stop_codon:yes gene_type:complete
MPALNSIGAGQPPAQPQPQGQATVASDDRENTLGSEQATAEEQDAYEKVVLAGDKIIFGDTKAREAVVKQLKVSAREPAKALADATALLVIQLDEQAGKSVPEAVILPAAIELLEHMAELADSLQLFQMDDAVVNRAGQIMVGNLGEAYGMQPEDMQAMVDSVPPEVAKQIVDEQSNYANKQPPGQEAQSPSQAPEQAPPQGAV